jgi:hypothetical protein
VAERANGAAKVSNHWVQTRDALSALLDPAERDAVLGDFAELALTDSQVLKSLVGLVVRRQLSPWKEWSPWFALIAIIIPLCPLLARLSAELNHGIWPSLWMKLHHGISYQTGISPSTLICGLCFQGLALMTWSWTSGFALGTLSRRAIWVCATLFFAFYLACASGDWLFSVGYSWLTGWAWLPLLVNFLVVLFPAYFGIRCRRTLLNLTSVRMGLVSLWTITIGGLALWTQGWHPTAMSHWSRGGSALTLLQLARHSETWNVGIAQVFATALLTSPIFYVFAQTAFIRRLSPND